MTSPLQIEPLSQQEIEDYGQARVRDQAFNAVYALWHRRRNAGMKQLDLAERLGWDPAVVSKKLSGPSNWTFKTFGALVEALDGEAEIAVFGKEDSIVSYRNDRAYAEFGAGDVSSTITTFQAELPRSSEDQHRTTYSASGNNFVIATR